VKTLNGGGKLDFLRRVQGLTVGGTAKQTTIPDKPLERILGGHNAPTVANFLRLLRVLRVEDVLAAFTPEDFE
jgi:hypothetical protein